MSVVNEQAFAVRDFNNAKRKSVVDLGRVIIDAFPDRIRKTPAKNSEVNTLDIKRVFVVPPRVITSIKHVHKCVPCREC
jgi:hypothetical protein